MAIQDEIPKSRLTLRYKTEVNGQPEDITLPLRLLVAGDFSSGTSVDRKVDLEARKSRGLDGKNTDSLMKDMGMSLNFSVANKIDPENEEDMQVSLPVTSMKSFAPDQICQQVPKLKGVLMVKRLLEEVIASVDNRKDFRKLLGELLASQDAVKAMLEELKDFQSFKLPAGKPKA